jgi:hypothetical protein
VAVGCAGPGQRPEYLSPELRSRVEQLEHELATEASTPENVFDRADILWQWMNAYSLTGGPVPVNLSMELAMIRIAEVDGNTKFTPPGMRWSWPAVLRQFDDYVRELQIKDEDPRAIGDLSFVSTEPLVSQTWATVELSYRVGTMPMVPGGGLLLGRQLMNDLGDFQHRDSAADNYVSIRCSDPKARFEPHEVPMTGMHGGFFGVRPVPAFRLEGTTLRRGDEITLVYGDRSGGGRGLLVQSFSTDSLLLPVYVDLEGKGNFLTPLWPSLEVIGGPAERATVIAPSVVAVGESFEVSVRSEDRFTNRAGSEVPGYELLLGEDVVRQLSAGAPAIKLVSELRFDEPGIYRFEARSFDGAITAVSNPVWVRENPPYRVFWGETHGHTAFAEGQGSPEEFFRYGREDSRLDFLALSEHDLFMDANEWRTLQELTRRSNEQGVVSFLGYEWTAFRSRGGHHNVLFRDPDSELAGFRDADRLEKLYLQLRANNDPENVLIIPHAHRAGDWTANDAELEPLAEIYSMHGSFEWFGNRYLANGFQVGFVGASDDHRAKPGSPPSLGRPALAQIGGLAGALAPTKTTDAIFEALRDRAVYATSGQRIILDATFNRARMGSRQRFTDRRRIRCRVMGTAPIDRIDVIKNGKVVYGQDYLSAPLRPDAVLQVSFYSSSEVFGEVVDNPRPYRLWEGSLELRGARVVGVDPIGFENPFTERAAVDPADPHRINFRTETRGRPDNMLVELEGASRTTELVFQLEAARERGSRSRDWSTAGRRWSCRWATTSTGSRSRWSIPKPIWTASSDTSTSPCRSRETTTMSGSPSSTAAAPGRARGGSANASKSEEGNPFCSVGCRLQVAGCRLPPPARARVRNTDFG